MSFVLAALLDTTSNAAVAVYLSLQNARARSDALRAAAEVTLPEQDLPLFEAVLSVHQSLAKERAALAHGVWGILTNHPDALIWCSPAKFSRWLTHANNRAWRLEFDPDPHAPLRKDLFVYHRADLEQLLEDLKDFFQIANRLHQYLAPIPNLPKAPIRTSILTARKVQGVLAAQAAAAQPR